MEMKWRWSYVLYILSDFSLSRSLVLSFSSAPERITKGKRIFREGFRDLRTDRDSYLPPISLSLSSRTLFFFAWFHCLLQKKKKRFFFFSSQLGFVGAGGIKKDSLYLRKVIDRYIIRTARYLLECHHVIDKTTYTRWSTFTHVYTYTHIHTLTRDLEREEKVL